MRVVHLCRTAWPHVGGMESAVGGLARALAERGHAVEVVTPDRAPGGEVLPPGRFGGVRHRRLPRVGPGRYPFARGLVEALRGADLVHAHGLDGLTDGAVLTRRWHGAPVGVSTHGGFFHGRRQRLLKELVLSTWSAAVLGRADAVWFTSAADRERLEGAGVDGPVVENGVDVAAFAAVTRRPRPGRWVVPGRVDTHKGVDDLIDVLGCLGGDRRPPTVDLAGPEARPGLFDDLRRRAAARGVGEWLVFHGEVEPAALRFLLGRAELALFPSRYEGFGIGVVEAMAAGVPVVVAAIPAFDALVRPGVDGYRVDYRDPPEAARVLDSLRDADHAAVAREARQAAAGHGWERRVVAWERAYEALLAGNR